MPSIVELLKFLEIYRVGDVTNILGFLITLGGFAITIYTVRKSKTVAEQTAAAVTALRVGLTRYDTATTLTTALIDMDEIKRLHRQEEWSSLPPKYTSVRVALTTVKASNTEFNDSQKAILTGAIVQFADMEQQIDRIIAGKTKADYSKLNKIVIKEAGKLQELLIELKNQIGR